ncbi:MAG: alpha/beta fold hydrolase [Labilithrix sp.]|nr:alpha/beta fold hydrolase [Labilithrix sp.]
MTSRRVTSSDGVSIAVDEMGRPDGQPIVFVHGFAQSGGIWAGLGEGRLAATYRLVAMDLRGHGASDKPEDERAYASERLGDDLDAVLRGLALERPVVAAWSYGGVVLGEYLRRRGGGALGGVLLVAAAIAVGKAAQALFGPAMMSNARALLSADGATYEAGARAFLGGCAATPLDLAHVERALVAMRKVPVHVRRALLFHGADYSTELARCEAPIATVHGDADGVVLPAMSALVSTLVPSCDATLLAGVGHLPWLEASEAFDETVRSIAERARTRSP